MSFLEKMILQLGRKSSAAEVNRALKTLKNSNLDITKKYKLATILASRKPNPDTVEFYCKTALQIKDSEGPYILYELYKNRLKMSVLQEFAVFAKRDNDPIYLPTILEYASSRLVDPIKIRNHAIKTVRVVLGGSSIVACFFQFGILPVVCALGINGAFHFKFPLQQTGFLSEFERDQKKYFFHTAELWNLDSIFEHFNKLGRIEDSLYAFVEINYDDVEDLPVNANKHEVSNKFASSNDSSQTKSQVAKESDTSKGNKIKTVYTTQPIDKELKITTIPANSGTPNNEFVFCDINGDCIPTDDTLKVTIDYGLIKLQPSVIEIKDEIVEPKVENVSLPVTNTSHTKLGVKELEDYNESLSLDDFEFNSDSFDPDLLNKITEQIKINKTNRKVLLQLAREQQLSLDKLYKQRDHIIVESKKREIESHRQIILEREKLLVEKAKYRQSLLDKISSGYKLNDHEGTVAAYRKLEDKNISLSALGTVVNALHLTGNSLESLDLYKGHRHKLVKQKSPHKTFVLNNLLKSVGFGGFPHYAEFIYLYEFDKLCVVINRMTAGKLCHSFNNFDLLAYNLFWTNIKDPQSETAKQIQSIFGCHDNGIKNVLEKRNNILNQPKPDLVHQAAYIAYSYYLSVPKYHNDPILNAIIMSSFVECFEYEAAIRIFAIYHQRTELDAPDTELKTYMDPFTKEENPIDMSIFERSNLTIGRDELFGKLSVEERYSHYPPNRNMFDKLAMSLSTLDLNCGELHLELQERRESSRNAEEMKEYYDND